MIKGQNKVFLAEESWTLVKIYLYASLQMVLIPQQEGQEEFATKLMAGCLAVNPFKRSFPGTFGYAGKDMTREDLAEAAVEILANPSNIFNRFKEQAKRFGIKSSLLDTICAIDWISDFLKNKLFEIYYNTNIYYWESEEVWLFLDAEDSVF